jgi:hypothetical protein
VVANLKAHAAADLDALAKELDLEQGWNELASVVTSQNGWLHKIVGNSSFLCRLFSTVSHRTWSSVINIGHI